MATWIDISLENEDAAKELVRLKRFRSSISRAYYSVYAAVTGILLDAGAIPSSDAENPSHKALPELIESNLPRLRTWQRRDLKSSTRKLYHLRLDADYRSRASVGQIEAVDGLAEMGFALRVILGRGA